MNRPRAIAAAGLAALLVGASIVVATTAGAADGLAQARRAQATTEPHLALVGQDFAVNPDGSFTLRYELTGLDGDPLELVPTTTTAPPETTPDTSLDGADPNVGPPAEEAPPPPPEPLALTVWVVNYAPLTDPDDLDDLVGDDPRGFGDLGRTVDGVAIDLRPLAERAEDGTVTFTLDIGTDVTDSGPDRLKMERPGLYPLSVQVRAGGDPSVPDAPGEVVATAGTVVQRLAGPGDPTPAPPLQLAVVTATDEPPPDATAGQLAPARRQLAGAETLARAVHLPVTVQAAPAVVAAASADRDPDDQLDAVFTDDHLVALPAMTFDVSSAAGSGLADDYRRLLTAGEDVLAEAAPTVPVRRDAWIAREALSGPGAQLLRELGTRVVVITEDAYRASVGEPAPRTDLLIPAALPDGSTLPLLVIDPLGAALTTEAADVALDESTTTEWAVSTLGRLLLDPDRDDDARQSRVLATPTLDAPDPRLVTALETLAATTPSIRFASAGSLDRSTDVARQRGRELVVELVETAGPDLTERLFVLGTTRLAAASAASMLAPDDARPDAWNTQLDMLLSTAYTDAEVEESTAELVAEAEAIRDAVALPEPRKFTMTGRSGTIEVRLRNTASEPLVVRLELSSSKMNFPEGDQTVTLLPAGETSVIVPVEALSNGTSAIELTLTNPAGELLDGPVTLSARVTALSGFGQVLTVGFVLVVATWWYSHWRTRRRAAALAAHPSLRTRPADDDAQGPVESATRE